jgi:hypothetical protein
MRRVAVIGATLGLAAVPAPAGAALPDLVSDQARHPQLSINVEPGKPARLLLRFHSYVHNRGPGNLAVAASGPAGGVMSDVEQLIDGVGAVPMAGAQVLYEDTAETNADGHDHFHLQRIARYSLHAVDDESLVAPSEKVGFCLVNSDLVATDPVVDPLPPTPSQDCGWQGPTQASISMGVSPRYRDVYGSELAFQWVDVSNTAPGTYRLRSQVDPDGIVDEGVQGSGADAAETNPGADVLIRVPGYVARAFVASATGTQPIVLDADAVDPVVPPADQIGVPPTLGARRFRIEEPPEHGSLDVTAGTWLTDPVVRYTPDDPSAPVADHFRYSVKGSLSDFPRDPQIATVTLGPGDPVGISGAPARMVAGTSVQLTANRDVTWSASRGAITAGGRFTAPSSPGAVEVRATAGDGMTDAVRIVVEPQPAPSPAPLPEGAPAGDPALVPPQPLLSPPPVSLPRRPIESARAQVVGRFVSVTTRPGRAGRLRIVLRRRGRTLTACTARVAAGRAVTCRLRRPSKGSGALRIVVQLRTADGRLTTRQVPVTPSHRH